MAPRHHLHRRSLLRGGHRSCVSAQRLTRKRTLPLCPWYSLPSFSRLRMLSQWSSQLQSSNFLPTPARSPGGRLRSLRDLRVGREAIRWAGGGGDCEPSRAARDNNHLSYKSHHSSSHHRSSRSDPEYSLFALLFSVLPIAPIDLFIKSLPIISRACETIGGTRGVQMRRFVRKRIAFFSNVNCSSNFRESANSE